MMTQDRAAEELGMGGRLIKMPTFLFSLTRKPLLLTVFIPLLPVANPTHNTIIPKIFPDTYPVSSTIIDTRLNE